MEETYENRLADIRREIEIGEARPAVIDVGVRELLLSDDERLPGDLLLSLSDRAEYDEGMFSLIHAAESYDDDIYIRALLSVFPRFFALAPRWASIVLMRVLNSDSTQAELVSQLRHAESAVKDALKNVCQQINEVDPRFLSKTVPVTLAAS